MTAEIDMAPFFDAYRAQFGRLRTDEQVRGIEFLVPRLLADERLPDVRHSAYIVATVWWETERTFQPIEEKWGREWRGMTFSSAKAYFNARYSHRADLGNPEFGPDSGFMFRGRGFCQITGANNYRNFSEILSLPLLSEPALALDPETAYEILVIGMTKGEFTGKRLEQYIRGATCNYRFARQIVNRMDRADAIERAAIKSERCLRAVLAARTECV
jgi:putative chitinase